MLFTHECISNNLCIMSRPTYRFNTLITLEVHDLNCRTFIWKIIFLHGDIPLFTYEKVWILSSPLVFGLEVGATVWEALTMCVYRETGVSVVVLCNIPSTCRYTPLACASKEEFSNHRKYNSCVKTDYISLLSKASDCDWNNLL